MKQFVPVISLLAVLTACASKNQTKKTDVVVKLDSMVAVASSNNKVSRDSALIQEFKTFRIYSVADTIAADFNGDRIMDIAYFTKGGPKSILIQDGKTKMESRVGADKSFSDVGSDFNWVDFWGTTNDSSTFESIVKNGEVTGGKTTRLYNISLFVRKDEEGGGVITYKGGKYIWVHQAD
jgi:hypothetical protein